jgi:hypothetical protein
MLKSDTPPATPSATQSTTQSTNNPINNPLRNRRADRHDVEREEFKVLDHTGGVDPAGGEE